ncbi:MAG: hypothetical protein ACP5XB_08585 [Isosphaeraceae bacterium]
MSTRKPKPPRRSLRPGAEILETRKLLSALSTTPTATVSGTDLKGDHWTLTLYGPGTLNVVDKNGQAFTKANQNIPDNINTIIVSGTTTSQSRLVGKVTYVPPGSDGRVFFQQLTIENTAAYGHLDPNLVRPRLTGQQNGIAAVDIPNFWLGNTSGTAPTQNSLFHSTSNGLGGETPFKVAGGIDAPEGINVLRFGGVDTTYTPPNGTPLNQTKQNNEFVINLGPPVSDGTSIILNKVISDAGSSTVASTTTTYQDAVTFVVNGRLNLFQANEIDGSTGTGLVPTQFIEPSSSTTSLLAGGTYLVSDVGGGTSTGQIGNIRIGGNVTNFTAMALATDLFTFPSADPSTGPQVSNFFIGGETNNVILVAPAGSRNVQFGRGMDNVIINSAIISNLKANRGAIGSSITVKRTIGNLSIGGDVVNTNIQSGYAQELSAVANVPLTALNGQTIAAAGVFNGQAPPTIVNRIQNTLLNQPTYAPLAHGGGSIHGRIAGNVTNSVISVAVDPNPSGINNPGQYQLATSTNFPFGSPSNIILPGGNINVKVEGQIDNSGLQSGTNPLVSPDIASNIAFFAKHVNLHKGPVVPPDVASAPYASPVPYGRSQSALRGLFKIDNSVQHPQRK